MVIIGLSLFPPNNQTYGTFFLDWIFEIVILIDVHSISCNRKRNGHEWGCQAQSLAPSFTSPATFISDLTLTSQCLSFLIYKERTIKEAIGTCEVCTQRCVCAVLSMGPGTQWMSPKHSDNSACCPSWGSSETKKEHYWKWRQLHLDNNKKIKVKK